MSKSDLRPTRFIAVLLVILACAAPLFAQDRIDPVAMGEARASIATVRGIGAIANNPGALDLPATEQTTLTQPLTFYLYDFGGTLGSTYFSSSEFQQIFAPKPEGISNEQRQQLGDLLQDERLFANGAISLLGVRYQTDGSGTFGLHYSHRVFARVNFPDNFRDLLRTSNIALQDYKFANRGIGADWATELGLSYGKSLGSATETGWFPTTAVGLTAKLLQGVAHFDISNNSIITITQTQAGGHLAFLVNGGYNFRSATPDGFDPANSVSQLETGLFPGSAGTGFGLDAGVSGVLLRLPAEGVRGAADALYYGLAVQDIGSISWRKNTYLRATTNIKDTLTSTALSNEQFKRYQGTLTPVGTFSTTLPAVLRAGIGMRVNAFANGWGSPLLLNIEGEFPLNNEIGNGTESRVSLGADWSANDWLSLRTGVSIGGISKFGVGLGAGIHPTDWLTIDLGTSELDAFFTGERVDLAFRAQAAYPFR